MATTSWPNQSQTKTPTMTRRWLSILVAALLAGCNQPPVGQTVPAGGGPGRPVSVLAGPAVERALLGNGKIQHVVIIVQENRSVDNLFNGLPGADTATEGLNSVGNRTKLVPTPMTARYDLDHSHIGFETEYDSGRMDGFNLEESQCYGREGCGQRERLAYGYVPQNEVRPYFDMAEQYVFADRMFETNQGPSFPAHQYLISGTSTIEKDSEFRASAKALSATQKVVGGCDSPAGSLALTIGAHGQQTRQVFPCFERPAITDLLDAKAISWHYYQPTTGAGLWNAFDAIRHIWQSPEYAQNVIWPSRRFFNDVSQHTLPNVVWVIPPSKSSDHPHTTDGSGPAWVASVVDAVGESSYWNNTAIFVLWDDWGGWYDHVKPEQYNSYELGFRVPLIVISPYAKKSFVSHARHEFGSILKFTEKAFGLPSLGTTDVRSDDLADCFNFLQKPRRFVPIKKQLSESYFLTQPNSTEPVDDDY